MTVAFNHELRMAIRAGDPTLPVLLDGEEVCAAFDVTPRQLETMVRDGVLEDMVAAGPGSLFRARQVREYLLSSASKNPRVSAILKRPLFGKGSRRARKAVWAMVVTPAPSAA